MSLDRTFVQVSGHRRKSGSSRRPSVSRLPCPCPRIGGGAALRGRDRHYNGREAWPRGAGLGAWPPVQPPTLAARRSSWRSWPLHRRAACPSPNAGAGTAFHPVTQVLRLARDQTFCPTTCARAGEPHKVQPGCADGGVYPRASGGARIAPFGTQRHRGLSPRERGSLIVLPRLHGASGSIPARAGEPHRRPVDVSQLLVYPRASGGASASAWAWRMS